MIYIDLVLNLTLLIALSIVSGFIEKRWARETRMGMLLQGVLFGGAAIIGMLRPLNVGPGLIFDGRSVMLSLCALFYGPVAAIVATAMTASCRIALGGVGTLMGVLVILTSSAIGLLGFYRLRPNVVPPSVPRLYLFGIVVHLAMLALMFTLPGNTILMVMKHIGPPVMLLFPLATILAGKILSDQVTALRALADLQMAKQNLATTLHSIGDAVISTNLRGEIVFMNPVAEALTGWSQVDACGRGLGEAFQIANEQTRERMENPVGRVLNDGKVVGLPSHTLLISRDGTERPIAVSAAPIRDTNGEITGVVLVFHDQSEQRRVQRLMQVRLTLLEYAADRELEELLSKALDEAGALVDSPIAFYHFVDVDQKTISRQHWSTRTLKEFCRLEGGGMHGGAGQGGAWVDAIQRREAVVHNNYASLLHKQGLSEEHARVVRELVVPVVRHGKVVAVLGVGNKPVDYTEKDVETIAYLADEIWQIIEKKRTEEVLQESEALFRNLFERHAAVKLIIDPDTGNIIDANQAAEDYYGWSREQLRQMRIQDINTLSAEEVKQEIQKARNLKRVHFEFRHRRADGSIRDVVVFSSKIEVRKKEVLHSIIHDITERKRAEAERQRLMAAIEQTGEMIMITSPQGSIEYVNPAFERVTGYSREEILGQNPWILNSGRLDEVLYRNLWNTIKRGGTWEGRLANRRKDGTLYTADVTISPIRDALGRIVSYVAAGRDVTEEIRLQDQLLQSQKMESVGRLAGGVAHDYNNMLGVIMGYTELALHKVGKTEPLYADLQEILKAARRSADMTRQLLAFARKQTISPVVLDLNETVEGMLKMLRRLIGEDIDLVWLPKADLWPVKMDPSQIDQILANLCVNARDAIEGVGKVTIETDMVTFDEDYCAKHHGFVPGEFVMLAVSDDGCGMDQAILENIFEPFFTTKDVDKGTGLGLATVYGIVKQNSGFINVYSEPGHGTIFKIYLPRTGMQAAKGTWPWEAKRNLRGSETVLLVEDEESILALGKAILRRQGYHVLAARNPAEALELVESYPDPIHLLITDVVMPGMNGKDLNERLSALKQGLKCIFMSGYTANVIAHHGVLDEGIHFLQKPFSLKTLTEKVREVLDT